MHICAIRMRQGLPKSWSALHIVNAKTAKRFTWIMGNLQNMLNAC